MSIERNTFRNTEDGWEVQQVDYDFEYQKQVTLTGAAQNIDLTLPFPVKCDRIDYYSDDTTAKSFTVRVFNGGVDTTAYTQVANIVLDTNQAITIDFEEMKFLHMPIVLRTAVSASTNGKKITIKVYVKAHQMGDYGTTY